MIKVERVTPISESEIMFYRNAIFQHYDYNVFMPNLGVCE